jgi:hypothetical protein
MMLYFSTVNAHAELLCQKQELKTVLLLQSSGMPTQFCDMSNLDNMPQEKILTSLPASLGIIGQNEWSGVSLKYLAQNLGAKEDSIIEIVALNDYIISIPMKSITSYNPILASRFNGKTISVRNKGPLILIYPFDKYKEINTPLYQDYTIWMIHEIRIK